MSKLTNKIEAHDRSISEVLNEKKYTVDYFQREYNWEQRHIEQLVTDLTGAFLNEFTPGDARSDGENYNNYYLGPFVVSEKDGKRSIIDGQQRLTSITLFLIYLNNLQKKYGVNESIESLIFSELRGYKSFNIQVEERTRCLNCLFQNGEYLSNPDDDESTKNMAARYTNISESFPEDIDRNTLPFFMDWIKHNVILVEIIAYSDENAYTIFETMNDRGLNLTPTEMLKGFMLSKFKDPAKRIKANEIWRDSIKSLHEWDKDEDQRFLQAWLRSQYAETIRPGKAGSKNEDFEKIGTRFHSWVRDNLDKVGLASGTADDFDRFINEDFCFYNRNYIKLLEATSSLSNFNEHVYYMSFWGIAPTLGYPLILSPLKLGDDEGLIAQKMNIVAKYIESFSVRRAVNFRNFSASSIRYTMYMLVKELRGKDVKTLTSILSEKLNSMEESFDGMDDFRLHGQNKYFVRFLLSRMTSFIEKECKINSSFSSYMGESSSKPFEIEHIWADKFSEHRGEFDQENQFNEYRNRIGALILLPNGTNQSFSDKPYSEKVGHYIKENALAQSLCSLNYQNNPNFTGMMSRLNLHFEPHCQFKKEDIIKRQALYIDICKKIWPDDLSSCLVEQQ